MTGIPWRLVGYGLAAAAVLWLAARFAHWCSDTLERAGKYDTAVTELATSRSTHAAYVAEAERQAAWAAQLHEHDLLADETLAATVERLEGAAADLRRAASRVPATVEKPNAQGVLTADINSDWWLCQSATLGGDPADAAACEAVASAPAVRAR